MAGAFGLSVATKGLQMVPASVTLMRRRIRQEESKRMRRLGKGIAATMRPEIPVGSTRNLRNSVTWEVKKNMELRVGPDNRKDGYHSHLVQAGTKQRRRERDGVSTGSTPPNDYLGRTEKKVARDIEKAGAAGLEKAVGRARLRIG